MWRFDATLQVPGGAKSARANVSYGLLRKASGRSIVSRRKIATTRDGKWRARVQRRYYFLQIVLEKPAMTHTTRPAVACLGTTASSTFPLILVIGREYNRDDPISDGDGRVSKEVGIYNFNDSSARCYFWNRAYRFLERNCKSGHDLKRRAINASQSPVLFSNVLPTSIPTGIASKRDKRRSIPEKDITAHLEGVLSLPIATRVKVVLLSVGIDPVFSHGSDVIRRLACQETDRKLIELPYFASRCRNEALDNALESKGREVLENVLRSFSCEPS